jgi:hypothetical protein
MSRSLLHSIEFYAKSTPTRKARAAGAMGEEFRAKRRSDPRRSG